MFSVYPTVCMNWYCFVGTKIIRMTIRSSNWWLWMICRCHLPARKFSTETQKTSCSFFWRIEAYLFVLSDSTWFWCKTVSNAIRSIKWEKKKYHSQSQRAMNSEKKTIALTSMRNSLLYLVNAALLLVTSYCLNF